MDDEELLIKAISANKEAFGQLVDRYKDKIIRLAFRFSRNYRDAEDIAQEVFIRAYLNLRSFKIESKISTWLYRITCNTAINYMRKRKKAVDYDRIRRFNPSDNASHNITEKEKKDMIEKAIERLPVKLQLALVLREYEDLSYKEIAEVLNCSIGTVESRIKRARDKLKVLIQPYIERGENI